MTMILANVLMALAICHTIVAYLLYRDAMVSLFRDGFVGAVAGHPDRFLAFWFALFSATLLLLGDMVHYAQKMNNKALLSMLAIYIGGIGIAGVLALPKSPFWIAIIVAPLLYWQAAGKSPL